MIIKLSPISVIPGTYVKPEVYVKRDVITINGEVFDFSPVPEGATLPSEAIASDKIVGDVTRENGEIVVKILLPLGENPSQAACFPQDIYVGTEGKTLELPQ